MNIQGRKVLVLLNRKAGVLPSWFNSVQRAMDRFWEEGGADISYKFCRNVDDGRSKAERAVDDGTDIVLAVGGDGTVNSVGRTLIGTGTALGVIPTGSGNGFARHFGIPLNVDGAVRALAGAHVRDMDVGLVDNMPFFVTCSMAWDASLVRSFEKWPIRGILPYVFAGVQEFLTYTPHRIDLTIDSGETLSLTDPVVFTVANLSQYGGGARIAPEAKHDDGLLELVVILKRDAAKLLTSLPRLFDGSIMGIPQVMFRQFKSLAVKMPADSPLQVDGEMGKTGGDLEVTVRPAALKVLVPDSSGRERR